MPVRYIIEEDFCEITLDTPPLNVIGQETRTGLAAALDAAEAAQVARVIVTGAGSAFAAGADAREFGGPPLEPHLPEILNRLERMNSIAAMNGIALGGGLEIALACRYRIAAPGILLGLPEVTLGVVPGAGGTQRLPRLIGVGKSAELISEGRKVAAEDALALGFVDVVAPNPLNVARTLPLSVLKDALSACDRPTPEVNPRAIEKARDQATKRSKSQLAPQVALELIEASATLPLAEGLGLERRKFLELRQGPQAAALRHVFFAETAAKARFRNIAGTAKDIKTAVVVGGGTMGAAIAYAMDRIGVATTILENGVEAAEKARANVAVLFDQAAKRGKTDAAAAKDGAARIGIVTESDALPPADLAIEAVFEDLAVKRQVMAVLDEALPSNSILATNTSYLDVNRVFEDISGPDRCLGLHFFSPAHIMKLVEVIRADATSEQTMATALSLSARLGKIPVEAGVCDGFIGNRILTRYRQICDVMLIEGALPAQVDAAMTNFGMAMGPYSVQDLSGLDIAYANRRRKNLKQASDIRYVPIADQMVETLKRLGRKTGAGWYDYPKNTAPQSSDLVEDLVRSASATAGIERRVFSDTEIVERATAAMIDEALRILDEGIARRPDDIDLVLVHGYGFPRWRGGIMHYADKLGLSDVRERISTYAAQDPLSWSVPPLLDRLNAEGRRLTDLNC